MTAAPEGRASDSPEFPTTPTVGVWLVSVRLTSAVEGLQLSAHHFAC